MHKDFDGVGNLYRPKRGLGWLGLIWGVLMGLATAMCAFTPREGQESGFIAMMVMLGSFLLLLIGMMIYGFTYWIQITAGGLREGTLFRTYDIPFHQITAIGTRTQANRDGSTDITRIEGNGRKITFESSMKDYPMLIACIRRNVGSEVQNDEATASAHFTAEYARQERKRWTTMLWMAFFMLAAIGSWKIQQGIGILMESHRTYAQKRPASDGIFLIVIGALTIVPGAMLAPWQYRKQQTEVTDSG